MKRLIVFAILLVACQLFGSSLGFCQSETPPSSKAPSSKAPSSKPAGAERPAEKTIDYWVSQLGNDHFLRREAATKKLIEAGPAAIDELVKVIRLGDLEVVERATHVIAEIAFSLPPGDDGGAWDQLHSLATQSVGRRASCAKVAIEEVRDHRAEQAREALTSAGVFVGPDRFVIQAMPASRVIVQIDDQWHGDLKSLQWLAWLRGVRFARIKGQAVTPEVIQQVTKIPGLQSLAISNVDTNIDDAALTPLISMDRILSVEFRYVALTESQGDLIASMPIRASLSLMGTGISADKVESMRAKLPGLNIEYRQGGFLGVECGNGYGICVINRVLPNSAAEKAGLIPGDVIVRIDNSEVARFEDLQKAINLHVPGDEVKVQFRRGDKTESVQLQLGRYEES